MKLHRASTYLPNVLGLWRVPTWLLEKGYTLPNTWKGGTSSQSWLLMCPLLFFSVFSVAVDQLSPYLDQKTDGFVESLYRKVLEVPFIPPYRCTLCIGGIFWLACWVESGISCSVTGGNLVQVGDMFLY